MTNFSVTAAARECPEDLALVVGSARWTYAELAEALERRLRELQTSSGTVAFVATPEVDSLLTIYAALELGRPLAPIHPRLPRAEQRRRLEECARFEPVGVGAAAPLAFLYTSGSSGRTRAVELSRKAFAAAAEASAERLGWRDGDRWLLTLSVAHVGGLSIVTRCLQGRRSVIVASGAAFSPDELLDLMARERVTLCSLVPTQLERLLDRGAPPPSLRAVLLGGAPARPALLERAERAGWPVLTTYGLTEGCAQVATQPPGSAPGLGVGPPLPGIEVRVQGGHIEIRSPALMTAYHPGGVRPALSPEGWFSTGDLGELSASGELQVHGRSDDVIVTGGEKVIPAEVEAALESLPAISAACAFGIEDPSWGQLVAAAVIVRGPLSLPALVSQLRQRLATFQRPRRLALLEGLPLTPTGKVDRRAVAREAASKLTPLSFD